MEREELIRTVTAAQNGDSEALNTLFNAFYNDVYYFALKTVKDDDLACDITQETFVEIINTLGDLQEPAAFVTWMKKITYHQCTRYFKKKKDVLVDEDEDGNTIFDTLTEERAEFIPDEALDQEDFRKTIMGMIDELSDEQRTAVMMFYFDELSVKQIAEMQGVSEGTVKSRLNYARKAIKGSVEEYEKKNNIKLHSFAFLPLLLWLFRGCFAETMSAASAQTVAAGVSTATGAAISVSAGSTATAIVAATATATGIGAKIAALPITTKIIAGVIAATVTIGGVVAVISGRDDDIPERNSDVVSTEDMTSTEDGKKNETVEQHSAYLVPQGATYTTVDGTIYSAGEYVRNPPQDGDALKTEEYTYRYNYALFYKADAANVPEWKVASKDGWGVAVNDRTKERYGPIIETINGAEIKSLTFTFWDCSNMTVAPEIPGSAISLIGAFENCVALKSSPQIPNGVTQLNIAFRNCTSLTETPYLPDSITDLNGAFSGCTSLITVTNFPSKLVVLIGAFRDCKSLVNVPDIPNTVEDITWAFCNCTSLRKAPVIPESVKRMVGAFQSCSSLTGTIEINAVLQESTIPCNNSCNLCAAGRYVNCRNCTSCCVYARCFAGEVQRITLTGTCSELEQIADTNPLGNVVVE